MKSYARSSLAAPDPTTLKKRELHLEGRGVGRHETTLGVKSRCHHNSHHSPEEGKCAVVPNIPVYHVTLTGEYRLPLLLPS